MNMHKPKLDRFNPAVLPAEYLPRVARECGETHTKHYLIPGRIVVTAEPTAISTIVGSGVSICLWDSVSGIGGANHFMLPQDSENGVNARFGNHANVELLRQLIALGADLSRIRAKVFGGSEPSTTFSSASASLGSRNVNVALEFLTAEKIRLVDRETGGTSGRKILFHTDDGYASIKRL